MSADFSIAAINSDLKSSASLRALELEDNGVGTAGKTQSGVGFAETLENAASNFVKTLEDAEAASIAGIKGDISAYEVASSVMQAEQTLRMTIAVRDKIVAAYLEITRMQI